jgi:hypothetical protein
MTVPELYMVIGGLVLFIIVMVIRDFIIFGINNIFYFCYSEVFRINNLIQMWKDPLRCYYCGRHARFLEENTTYFGKQFCDFGEYRCDVTMGPQCKGHTRRLCSYQRHFGEREIELIKNVQQMDNRS